MKMPVYPYLALIKRVEKKNGFVIKFEDPELRFFCESGALRSSMRRDGVSETTGDMIIRVLKSARRSLGDI